MGLYLVTFCCFSLLSVGFRKELPKLRLVQKDAKWDAGWSLARMLGYVPKQ